MSTMDIIRQADVASLKVIQYPDPRLAQPSEPLDEIDSAVLAPLIDKMFELMHAAKGVGLAAPQVGLNVRFFVGCPTGEADDRRVYINPKIISTEGSQDDEEGCLSVPGIHVKIRRYDKATIEATDLTGRRFQESGTGLLARLFQHETDHLDGRLIVDRMGTVSKLAHRRAIRDMEEKFEQKQAAK